MKRNCAIALVIVLAVTFVGHQFSTSIWGPYSIMESTATFEDYDSFIQYMQELSEYKSVRGKLRTSDLERENTELRGKMQRYEDVIQRNNLWHFFRPRREKAAIRDDAR